tara:strand:- start:15777 stop:16259 length:483 start_codon:yes stop_codon:yes gene_type:complete
MAEPCTNFAQIKFDECLIQNNAWGYEGHHPPQCIQGPPGAMPGWKWDWPGQDRTRVQAYPELIYGKKPWSATSTTPGLPQRLSGISRIDADYDIHTKASGCYNAAFELWLTRTSAADSADITSEIMIWVSCKGLRPAGSFLKSVETPHGTADLYEALSMP